MEAKGFEPLTPGLQSRCSSQLSYAPTLSLCGRVYLPALAHEVVLRAQSPNSTRSPAQAPLLNSHKAMLVA